MYTQALRKAVTASKKKSTLVNFYQLQHTPLIYEFFITDDKDCLAVMVTQLGLGRQKESISVMYLWVPVHSSSET